MATAWARSWLREPLLHFVLLGAAAAGLYALSQPAEAAESRDRIVLTEADLAWRESSWRQTRLRPPTPEEFRRMVDAHVREEILYREAVRLGLDRDDPILRRRLATKLEFLAKDLGASFVPTDAELRAFLDEREDRYRVEGQRAFVHVYLNEDQRGEKGVADAEALLAALRTEQTTPEQALERGDRFLLRSAFSLTSRSQIARELGTEFADELLAVAPGAWSGPIRSGYGLHLVRVLEATPSRPPEFEEVRARLRDDFIEQRRQQTMDAFYEAARARYDVEIELPG